MLKFEAKDAIVQPPPGSVDEVAKEEEDDEATKLFKAALKLLNSSSSSSKRTGWDMMDDAADLGHKGAKVRVAWARLTGTVFKQDLVEAKKVFDEAANVYGEPDAQTGLAFLQATGTMVNSSQAEALLYYTFAAFGGSPWAQV